MSPGKTSGEVHPARFVCSSMFVPTNFIISGSSGVWPEQNSKFPVFIAWQYGPMASGASVTFIDAILFRFLFIFYVAVNVEHLRLDRSMFIDGFPFNHGSIVDHFLHISHLIAYPYGVSRSRRPFFLSFRTHIALFGPCSTSLIRLSISKRSTSSAWGSFRVSTVVPVCRKQYQADCDARETRRFLQVLPYPETDCQRVLIRPRLS